MRNIIFTEFPAIMFSTPEDINDILDEYAPLVKRIARSACYSSATIDIADLHQVGEIAVLRAIKTYDPSSGTSIKSFVTRLVKRDIYNEAARFLGVFTVDHTITGLASRINRLTLKGHTDDEIVLLINNGSNRNFDIDHVCDLRIAYNRRNHTLVDNEDIIQEDPTEETTIRDLLQNITHNPNEAAILQRRILGDSSAQEVADSLSLSRRRIYEIENHLKQRIRKAIEDMTA